MAYKRKTFETITTSLMEPNFLASEVGIITKTHQFKNTGLTADSEGRKILKAGTLYPKNDATAIGIVFQDLDVTESDIEGALMMAGRVYKNRLPVLPDAAAITALEAKGLYFDTCPETTR